MNILKVYGIVLVFIIFAQTPSEGRKLKQIQNENEGQQQNPNGQGHNNGGLVNHGNIQGGQNNFNLNNNHHQNEGNHQNGMPQQLQNLMNQIVPGVPNDVLFEQIHLFLIQRIQELNPNLFRNNYDNFNNNNNNRNNQRRTL